MVNTQDARSSPVPEAHRRQGRLDNEKAPVHIKSKVLTMTLEIEGGSPTEVILGVPDCGGFIRAYGDMGPEKLRSLSNAVGQAVETWLSRNEADFGIG